MTVLHVDANSAYLSWTAVKLLEQGYSEDIRNISSVIAGDPDRRQGIVLAKSIPAKRCGIRTGTGLFEAVRLCPGLLVFPPDYDLYLSCSEAMYEILQEYSPTVQRFSIDECFADLAGCAEDAADAAHTAYIIKERIKKELGFTVNVGVGSNKLLAKMAGELQKPDKVHTLLNQREIEEKLWPMPVGELFMAGRASVKKLKGINIRTIGELANSDVFLLRRILKSHGQLLWEYANGIDRSQVIPNQYIVQKGLSNGMTLPCDVTEAEEAEQYILALSDRVTGRLRRLGCRASQLGIAVKTSGFCRYTHRMQLLFYLDDTTQIYRYFSRLFEECWRGEPVRQIGVHLTDLVRNDQCQMTFYDMQCISEDQALNRVVDQIRIRFGQNAIYRGTFVNTDMKPLEGGVNDGNYMMMGGYKQ